MKILPTILLASLAACVASPPVTVSWESMNDWWSSSGTPQKYSNTVAGLKDTSDDFKMGIHYGFSSMKRTLSLNAMHETTEWYQRALEDVDQRLKEYNRDYQASRSYTILNNGLIVEHPTKKQKEDAFIEAVKQAAKSFQNLDKE